MDISLGELSRSPASYTIDTKRIQSIAAGLLHWSMVSPTLLLA
jgi:hypothetical protein